MRMKSDVCVDGSTYLYRGSWRSKLRSSLIHADTIGICIDKIAST
jgi:hypothetical protein